MISCCMTETTIGIIIGSMFTLLGVIINGVITFIMSCSSHNREVEEHKRCEQKKDGDTKRAKREMAYRGFVNYYGLMNLLIGFAYASNDNEVDVNLFREIFAEEFKKNLAKSSEVISEIMLYGSDVIVEKCGRYVKLWNAASHGFNSFSVEDCANLDQELLCVVTEMKKELGFDSL